MLRINEIYFGILTNPNIKVSKMEKVIRLLAKLPYYPLGLLFLLGGMAVFMGVILGVLTQSEWMGSAISLPGFIVFVVCGSALIEKMSLEKKEV